MKKPNKRARDPNDEEQILLFATRLRDAVEKFGGPTAASKALKMPISTLNDYLAANTEPKMSLVPRIARTLGTTIEYLYGTSDRLRTEVFSEDDTETLDAHGIALIPRLNVRLSAGIGVENSDTLDEIEQVPISLSLLRRLNIKPENAHIIEAAGDSMEETIFDRDDVLIDRGDRDLKAEGIYAVVLGDLGMIKRVQPLSYLDTVTLISDNSRYQPQTVKRGEQDQLRTIGRAKLVMRAL